MEMGKPSFAYDVATVDCSLLINDRWRNDLEKETVRSLSLGVGSFPENGPVMFLPSPAATECSSGVDSSEHSSLVDLLEDEKRHHAEFNEKCASPLALAVEQLIQVERGLESMVERSVEFFVEKASTVRHTKKTPTINADDNLQEEQHSFSFMKVSDLKLDVAFCTAPAVATKDSNTRWVQLTLGSDEVQSTVKALAEAGLLTISDEKLWKADKKTEKILQERGYAINDSKSVVMDHEGTQKDAMVLIWSGKQCHNGYDIPVFRSSGIISMSADDLVDLLLDSSRIHEYNKVSEGRTDEIIYTNDLYAEGGITKVVRSKSKPPIVSKSLEYVSLMHARTLTAIDGHGQGYLLVTRGVTLANENFDPYAPEILLNISLIKKIDGVDKKCEMINMNYVSMPMIPSFLVKKLGYNGAVSFFHDLRALCSKCAE
jgi:hypothetical protein